MPLVDLTNPGSGTLAKQLTGPFGKYLPTGEGADNNTPKAFMEKSYPTTIQAGGDGVTNIDDPTYLGFALSFQTDSSLFQGLYETTPNSAIGYLTQVDPTRAAYLRAFLIGLLRVNRERPWYFQTITGLTEAWQKNTTNPKDPFVGTAPGEGVDIGCIEAIDLKLTALFSLYRMACYDNKYRRFILPENLRRFDINVSILEIRNFKQSANWMNLITDKLAGTSAGDFMADENTKSLLHYVNKNTSQVTFKFTECEWDAAAGGKVFDTVSNVGGDIASTSIKFSYGNVVENAQFSGYDSKLEGDLTTRYNDASQGDGKFNFKDAVKELAKDQIANQANGALSSIESAASGFSQKLTIGNVYGAKNNVFDTINNPQAITNAAIGGAAQLAELNETDIISTAASLGSNIFGNGVTVNAAGGSDGSLEKATIFGDVVQPGVSLPTERIHPSAYTPGNNDGVSPPGLDGNDNIFD